jgi:hypothetical protein
LFSLRLLPEEVARKYVIGDDLNADLKVESLLGKIDSDQNDVIEIGFASGGFTLPHLTQMTLDRGWRY